MREYCHQAIKEMLERHMRQNWEEKEEAREDTAGGEEGGGNMDGVKGKGALVPCIHSEPNSVIIWAKRWCRFEKTTVVGTAATANIGSSDSAMPLCGIVLPLPLSKRPKDPPTMLFSLRLFEHNTY